MKYTAQYQDKDFNTSSAEFKAKDRKEALAFANMHKRRVKTITLVSLKKSK